LVEVMPSIFNTPFIRALYCLPSLVLLHTNFLYFYKQVPSYSTKISGEFNLVCVETIKQLCIAELLYKSLYFVDDRTKELIFLIHLFVSHFLSTITNACCYQ
jgi:ABC-type enterochelin transport system permease subunit